MDTLLQIGYWSFLPQIGTSILQSAYYQLRSKPAEGTPEYKQHKKNAFITVIILYLIYSIYQENAAIPTNFYEILQISPLATDKQIKIQHRQLSLLYHPDKVQSTDGSSENYFIEIRNAYEILKDPVKRVAYDHFGIKSFECVRCYFYKDYFSDNISSTLAYYAITVIVVSLLSFMKNFSFGRYWRFTSLIGLGAFELYFLVNESDPLPYLFHWRTISEKIILLRHIFMVSSIAILQLGPVLFPYDKRSMRDLLINELEPLLIALNEQSKVQLNTNMHAFDVKSKGVLKHELERLYIERALEQTPEFQQAFAAYKKSENERLHEEHNAKMAADEKKETVVDKDTNGSNEKDGVRNRKVK